MPAKSKRGTTKKSASSFAYLEFAGNVSTLRTSAGLTQSQLADKVGINRLTVWRIESGNTIPNLDVAERMAVALGTTLKAALGILPSKVWK